MSSLEKTWVNYTNYLLIEWQVSQKLGGSNSFQLTVCVLDSILFQFFIPQYNHTLCHVIQQLPTRGRAYSWSLILMLFGEWNLGNFANMPVDRLDL